jgi:hypothetical protein
MQPRIKRTLTLFTLAGIAALIVAAPAPGTMRVKQLEPHLCKVVNGGRFVRIPGFPGEKVDRRLLPDIHWMVRKFHIFITDAYSTDPVHAGSGEHPIGLATDIVPNTAKGGTWNDIAQLHRLAEPHQNEPIMPWRWVGWNGDPGHGRGNHLHLSWSHSDTKPRHPARVVYTRICPEPPGDPGTPQHHHRHHAGHQGDGSGGVSGGNGDGSGGIGSSKAGRAVEIGRLAPIVPELREGR